MKAVIATIIYSIAILSFFYPFQLHSQESEIERKKARTAMSYFKDNNDVVNLSVKLSHREGKNNVYPKNINVKFYINEINEANLLGEGLTNKKGLAKITLEDMNQFMDSSHYTFISFLPESELYFEKITTIKIQKADFQIELLSSDSTRIIKIKLQKDSSNYMVAVSDEKIKFFIQRTFSLLPFGGKYTYTDEKGEVFVDFPNDLPGDENGNIEIVVQVLEHELFGTVERRISATWGIPLVIDNSSLKNNLWSSAKNAPISLVVISVVIVFSVWGVIFYLIMLLFKVKKIGKQLV